MSGLRAAAQPFHWLYATLLGYFWLPCPLCGRMSGGHQWKDRRGLSSSIFPDPTKPGSGKGICPTCTLEGRGDSPFRVIRRTTA